MKKNRMNLILWQEKVPQSMLRKMRLTLLFSFLVIFQVGASSFSVAQKKVTLSLKDVSLEKFFMELRQQTGDIIVFSNTEINTMQKVSVNSKDELITDILDRVLKGLSLGYRIVEDYIVVYKVTSEPQVKERKIVGSVKDENKVSLPGVTISVKGTTSGVVTDKTGWYRIGLPGKGDFTLVFSFVGMKKQEVKYTGQDTIHVVMKEDVREVEEVVVTGYQTVKKRSMTGSTSNVRAEDLVLNGSQTLEQALQGKIPGMMVMSRSGLTGTRQRIRVRGTSTLMGNAEPVWVVDGVIQEDPLPFETNDLNNLNMDNMDMIRDFVGGAVSWLNPNDIEDVTVLKDASSTAIYGVKAANGVIVITTKKGKIGRMAVSYSGNFSFSPKMTYNKLELMNSQERVDVSREAYERNLVLGGNQEIGYMGLALAYKRKEISLEAFSRGARELEETNTDWFDLLFRDAFSHNHNVSISGGNDKTSYRASFGVSESKNTAKGNERLQYTGNMSMGTTLWENLTLNVSLAGSQSTTKAFAGTDPFGYANSINRAIPCFDDQGDLFFYRHDNNGFLFNILNELNNGGNENTQTSVNSSLSLRWRILEGLAISSQLSFSNSSTDGHTWRTEQSNYIAALRLYDYEKFGEGSQEYKNSHLPHGGEFNKSQNATTNFSLRNQIEYMKVFNGVHAMSVMLGQEMRSTQTDGYSERIYGYLHDRGRMFVNLPKLVGQYGNTANRFLNGVPKITDTETNYMSFYTALSYMYDDRYAFNMSCRMDASNRFGQDKSTRYKPVWSFGLRWNVGSEHWLEGQNLLSDMSLRASYGFQGNVAENVSPNLIATISTSDQGDYQLSVKDLPAPYLKWEKVQSMNLGVDFSFFKRKIHGSFEYYYKKTTDMVVNQQIPYENGVTTRPVNGGDMSNKGWDANVSFVPVRTKDFVVSLGFTFGKVYNKVESRLEPSGSWQEAAAGNLNKEGYPVSSFWAFRFKGLNPLHGGPEFDLTGLDEDGASKDATLYMDCAGKVEPDFTSGVSFSIRYKTLSLSSGLYLSLGNQQFLAPMSSNYTSVPSEYENMSTEWLNRWRRPGDEKNTNIPSLPDIASNAQRIEALGIVNSSGTTGTLSPYELYAHSSIRVVDAWYLRCNSISLAYTLPEEKLPRFVKSMSLNCSVSNPFQIRSKDFLGRDPEVALGSQPLSKNWSLGLSMSF